MPSTKRTKPLRTASRTNKRQNLSNPKRSEGAKKAHDTKAKISEDCQTYVTICEPAWNRINGEGEVYTWDDEEEDEDGDPACPVARECMTWGYPVYLGSKKIRNCMCDKPASEHPDHPWIYSVHAIELYHSTCGFIAKRNPDNFGMHVYSDSEGYGMHETLQNIILDFDKLLQKKNPDVLRLWSQTEALALVLQHAGVEPFLHIDDGNGVCDTVATFGVAILCTLRLLKKKGLLESDSTIPNVGLVAAMFFDFLNICQPKGVCEEKMPWMTAIATLVDAHISESGVANPDDIMKEYRPREDDEETFAKQREEQERYNKDEPSWARRSLLDYSIDDWENLEWTDWIKRYVFLHGSAEFHRIGGSHLDITKWPKAERERYKLDLGLEDDWDLDSDLESGSDLRD